MQLNRKYLPFIIVYLAVMLILTFALISNLVGEDEPKPAIFIAKPVPVSEPIKELVTTYDAYPDLVNFGPNFTGSDIIAFSRFVWSHKGAKTDYETQADYKNRVLEKFKTNSQHPLIEDKYLIFTDDPIILTYNLAKKAFPFSLSKAPVIDVDVEAINSYIGQNAFGVARKIDKKRRNLYTLDIQNMPKVRNYDFKIEPSKAEKSEDDLRYFYVVKLTSPYYSEESKYKEPTINDPKEVFTYTHNVKVKLFAIGLYNLKTGEVIVHKKL